MKITVKYQVLKSLRESRNIPIETMPKRLNISNAEYEKLEVENTEVDIAFARKLANIFKHNWSVFLLDEAPSFIGKNVDNRTHENKTPALSSKTVDAMENARFVLAFAQSMPIEQEVELPNIGSISSQTPETVARKLRKISGISIEDQKHFKDISKAFKTWLKFIESLGIFVSQYSLGDEDKVRAFSMVENKNAIIVLNTDDIYEARIFSLFHEMWHIMNRRGGICDLEGSNDTDIEVLCNRFAAAFLAPMNIVEKYIEKEGKQSIRTDLENHVGKLAFMLKVSKLVIYRRFTTVGLLDNEVYSEIHRTYLKTRHRRRKTTGGKKSGGNYYTTLRVRNGNAFSREVIRAYDAGSVTLSGASSALGIAPKNFENYRYITASYRQK